MIYPAQLHIHFSKPGFAQDKRSGAGWRLRHRSVEAVLRGRHQSCGVILILWLSLYLSILLPTTGQMIF